MIKAVVFDLGGVLVDWNPRYLYRNLIADEQVMEDFLANVCTDAWNYQMDLGRNRQEAVDELIARFPQHTDWITAFKTRWIEMIDGPIHESVDILMDLKRRGYPVYALSNWNDETFQLALSDLPFLRLFDGRIVSGEVKLGKPDPAIYQLLLSRFNLNPREIVFIDDREENVVAARNLGIESIRFISPAQLERDLAAYGLFPDNDDETEDTAASGGCGEHCTCHVR